jgi:hypothetical protein
MKLPTLLFICSILLLACQKNVQDTDIPSTNSEDSTIIAGDTLTYEVLTSDSVGWFGIWNQPDGALASNALDSITYGSPVYLPSGWRYTFISPSQPFQAFISAASHLYSDDITVNLYKNGELIKSVTNDALKGVAKLLVDIEAKPLKGTLADPVLTYEVLVSDPDTTKFESDGWIGQWTNPQGVNSDLNNPLPLNFAIPSGWKYSFKPEQLPFTMRMGASPYTKGGGKITINFYVNGQLVKSAASRNWLYDFQYIVQ